MELNKVILNRLFLIISGLIVILSLFFDFYTKSYYSGAVADDAYYYSVASSLLETGVTVDATTIPNKPTLNAHWAIVIVYAIFISFGLDFLQISIVTSLIGGFLMLVIYFNIRNILERLSVSDSKLNASFIVLLLTCYTYYLAPVLAGRTETFFFPLLVYWLDFTTRNKGVETTFNWKVYYIFISMLLFAFRLQALLIFISLLFTYLFHKEVKAFFHYLIYFGLAIILVYLINSLLSGHVLSEAENGLVSETSSLTFEKLVQNLSVVLNLFSNSLKTAFLLYNKIVFVLVMILGIGSIFVCSKKDYLRHFFVLIVCISIAAFVISIPTYIAKNTLRYISYIIPILLLLVLSIKTDKKIKKLILGLLIITTFGSLHQIQSDFRNLNLNKYHKVNRNKKYLYFNNLLLSGEERIYGYSLLGYETHRLIYSSTNKSLYILDNLNNLNDLKGYLLIPEKLFMNGKLKNNKVIYTFKINEVYVLLKLGQSSLNNVN